MGEPTIGIAGSGEPLLGIGFHIGELAFGAARLIGFLLVGAGTVAEALMLPAFGLRLMVGKPSPVGTTAVAPAAPAGRAENLDPAEGRVIGPGLLPCTVATATGRT